MADNMNHSPEDHTPSNKLMKGDVLVEGNDRVQRRPSKVADKVPTYRQKNESDVDLKNKSTASGRWIGISERSSRA